MSGDTGEDESASFRKIVATVLGNGNVEVVIQTMPTELKAGLASAFSAFTMARKEQVLALMPYIPQF